MSDSLFRCRRCGLEGEYYSTGKTLCPVTRKVVCDSCAEAAQVKYDHFGGSTYDPARDKKRLSAQQQAVLDVMRDGKWHTSAEVAEAIGAKPESYSAVTARIRGIRTIYNNPEAVESKNLGGGRWIYRMTVGVAA
jgi:hypothetical protein